MRTKADRLMFLLDRLGSSFKTMKMTKVTSEQVMKAENINVAEGATLNIQQNQVVVVHQVDKDISEAKEIVSEFARMLPGEGMPFTEAINNYKQKLVLEALQAESHRSSGRKKAAAERIQIHPNTMKYILKRQKEVRRGLPR